MSDETIKSIEDAPAPFKRQGELTGPPTGKGEITLGEHNRLAEKEALERRGHRERDDPHPGQK